MKLASYLMLYGDGNNHLYGGAKKHCGVTPRFSVHLAYTHSHLLVSLDTTLLRFNLLPFAIASILSLCTYQPWDSSSFYAFLFILS